MTGGVGGGGGGGSGDGGGGGGDAGAGAPHFFVIVFEKERDGFLAENDVFSSRNYMLWLEI